MPKEELIKEFDIIASKLGLDGEQMDELRDVLRKALKAKNQEHKRYLEILQEEIAIGIMEAKEKVKQDLLKKIGGLKKLSKKYPMYKVGKGFKKEMKEYNKIYNQTLEDINQSLKEI